MYSQECCSVVVYQACTCVFCCSGVVYQCIGSECGVCPAQDGLIFETTFLSPRSFSGNEKTMDDTDEANYFLNQLVEFSGVLCAFDIAHVQWVE